MTGGRDSSRLHFLLALIVAFSLHAVARAQTPGDNTSKEAAPAGATIEIVRSATNRPANSTDQLDQVELLRKQVEQLQPLLERQQVSLTEIQKQLAEMQGCGSLVQASPAPAADVSDTTPERDASVARSATTGSIVP